MKKRFIGPANPGPDGEDLGHDVVIAGQSVGNVKPGDVLELDDDLAKQVGWSGDLWEDAASSKKKSEGEDR